MSNAVTGVVIRSPLSGVRVALERVPDPVFAGRIAGDGLSIDPISDTLLAPCDATVIQLHASRHAISLRAEQGIELLLHIGVDTVSLRGAGFEALVAEGDRVVCGQPLIRFDIDAVARSARSLLTQVLVAGDAAGARIELARGPLEAGRSVLFTVHPGAADERSRASGELHTSALLRIPNPTGLHARPAAVLAERAKAFRCELTLRCGERRANLRSLVSIMALGTVQGDEVTLEARGADAEEALAALAELVTSGCGEDLAQAEREARLAAAAQQTPAAEAPAGDGEPGVVRGLCASPGLSIGRVQHWRRRAPRVDTAAGSPAQERHRLERALGLAGRRLEQLAAGQSDAARRGVLGAQRGLLEDPGLFDAALAGLAQGHSAGVAWRDAYSAQAAQLGALSSAVMRERAADLRDVGESVLRELSGEVDGPPELVDGCILIAEELTPSETAQLDRARIRGLCTTGGGPTGHVAILARSLGLPALVGAEPRLLQLAEGSEVLLDAGAGLLRVAPDAAQRAAAEAAIAEAGVRATREREAALRPAHSRDGTRIEVVANIRHAADAREAVAAGAEGVGLLRSEFLFDDREQAPDEDEQAAAYAAVVEALGPERPLVIRTLDVGGDKPLPYLPLPREENPFLGLRGVRVSLAHPELFRTQLRALLRGAGQACLHVMLPMVATLEELRAARAALEREAADLGLAMPKLGVMIEVPSAALIAGTLAREADFFSIGSNDLTQYTLAMDRGHARLASQADALHPSVLRLIGMAASAAGQHGRWVGVCGAIAADPLAVPALLGLGITELSVPAPAVASVKAAVGRCALPDCRALAGELLELGTAAEVRARLADWESAHAR